MSDPSWDAGCPVRSYQADNVGDLAHLHSRNTTYAAVSRAPISKIEPFRQRMGWTFPWYSQLLDLTPLGRQDETVELRHHDKHN